MLVEKIKKDLISHIKAGDKTKISITRLLIAALKDKEISLRKTNDSSEVLTDELVMEIINKMIKQRNITAQTYIDAGRQDLAEKEQLEAKHLVIYLPKQLTEQELSLAVDKAILESKAITLRDMGRVMQVLKDKYAGKCDFQFASSLVKKKLANTG